MLIFHDILMKFELGSCNISLCGSTAVKRGDHRSFAGLFNKKKKKKAIITAIISKIITLIK